MQQQTFHCRVVAICSSQSKSRSRTQGTSPTGKLQPSVLKKFVFETPTRWVLHLHQGITTWHSMGNQPVSSYWDRLTPTNNCWRRLGAKLSLGPTRRVSRSRRGFPPSAFLWTESEQLHTGDCCDGRHHGTGDTLCSVLHISHWGQKGECFGESQFSLHFTCE